MRTLKSRLKIILLAVIMALLALAVPVGAAGSNSGDVGSGPNITEAYSSNQPIEQGMIVGLDPGSPNEVRPLDKDHIKQMQGVVVPASSASVTIANQKAEHQIYVATLGRYQVLVSDQNGAISAGDYVTISSLAGVGMKASINGQLVVGKAVSGFDGTGDVRGNANLKSSNGATQKVHIGLVSVDLGIAHNPLGEVSHQIAGFSFLQSIAQSLVGKDVSPPRIYAALGIFVIAAIIAIAIAYSGIRGSMIATGRNPLAKNAIGRHMLEVVLTAVLIFIIGLGAIYLVLKL